MNGADSQPASYDVVILGAGYAGLMAAIHIGRRKWNLRVALVNAREHFVERQRLQEDMVGQVARRIPSIAKFLSGTTVEFIHGSVTSLDAKQRRVRIASGAYERDIVFDQAIYSLGSTVNVEGVEGAAEHAYRLDAGDGPRAAAALRSALHQNADRSLRVVAVGGGPTAIEVAGEIKTTWPHAEMTMISQTRCGDFSTPRVETIVRGELARLGVVLIDGESVSEVRATEVVTEAGRSVPCDICVWSGGMRSSPIARHAGLAIDPQDRIVVDPNLRSISHSHILAVGDAAHPTAPTGAPYRNSVTAAVVSGKYAAEAVLARRANRELEPFSFSTAAQAVAIGRFGVIFLLSRDDVQIGYVLKGRSARQLRNLLVWFVPPFLRIVRRFPSLYTWPGRHRVSWAQANESR